MVPKRAALRCLPVAIPAIAVKHRQAIAENINAGELPITPTRHLGPGLDPDWSLSSLMPAIIENEDAEVLDRESVVNPVDRSEELLRVVVRNDENRQRPRAH